MGCEAARWLPDKTIAVADVYSAFSRKQGLLLIEKYLKRGIHVLEPHPTNKGYEVIEEAFARSSCANERRQLAKPRAHE
jgi:NAD-dependent oxidoreductase involved in siderophore biosynthesis